MANKVRKKNEKKKKRNDKEKKSCALDFARPSGASSFSSSLSSSSYSISSRVCKEPIAIHMRLLKNGEELRKEKE